MQPEEPELVGKLASSSTYDEAFLSCTDGYCIFNAEQCLSAYSAKLANLYPAIRDDLYIGMRYADYLRLFVEKRAVQNLDGIDDVESWLETQLLSTATHGSYKHHLHDGRWMQIKFNRVTDGQCLFTAHDITYLHQQQEELRKSEVKMISFARLASDWFWELDKDFRYVFFSSHTPTGKARNAPEYEGLSRIDVLEQAAVPDDQLHLHISQLRRHERVDVVIEWKTDSAEGLFGHVVAEPQFDKQGRFCGYIGCGRDVSNEITLRRQLKELAEFDDLTGLRNRRAFEHQLKDTIASTHFDWRPKTLAYIDLDRFKQVNDGSGHQAGDTLLVDIAAELERSMQPHAIVARLGGDEFGVIFNLDVERAYDLVNTFIHSVSSREFEWKGKKYMIGASAGLTTINGFQADHSDLMVQADTACYSAKNAGRNLARVFSHRATRAIQEKKEPVVAERIRRALEEDGFELYLQPIKAIRSKSEQHWFEVLVRLPDSSGKPMLADEIVPVAEKYNLASALDKQVLVNAIADVLRFGEMGVDVFLSVNLSGYSLADPAFRQWLNRTLDLASIQPGNLGFEFAESSAIMNLDPVVQFTRELKEQGYRISLDDFGSQFSSFEYIRKLPLNYLKIDGNVIRDMTHNATCRVIVSTFIQLSHELGVETIAENVENRDTEDLLLRAGVDYVQGYGIGKPLSAQSWLDWYRPARRKEDRASRE